MTDPRRRGTTSNTYLPAMNLHLPRLPVLFLALAIYCMLVDGQRTDKCNRGFKHCGNNKCCCTQNTALCKQFGKKLDHIPPLPSNIIKLSFLSNFLPELSQDTFTNISQSNIVSLALSYNQIRSVSANTFSGFTNIRILTLNGNIDIDKRGLSKSFGSIPKISQLTLNLEKIGVSELSDLSFIYLSHVNVTNIHLNRNGLKTLNMTAFLPLTQLRSLSVRDNTIREMTEGVGHATLEDLDMSRNEIARNPPALCLKTKQGEYPFPNLRHLDLRGNYISELPGNSWRCLYRLQFLSLSGNVIRKITKNSFRYLNNLHELQLANMHGSIERIETYAFNNSRLLHINLQKNSIVLKEPYVYDIFKGCYNVQNLDMSHNNFKYLSSKGIIEMLSPMQRLKELTLVRANIHKLPVNFLRAFPNLTKVNLDGNHINSLRNVFTNAGNVTTLSLQSNKLHVVDRESLSDSLVAKMRYLNLALNPLDCTCEMLWFRTAIGDHGRMGNMTLQNWPTKYFCATPSSKKDTRFLDYRPTSFDCENILLISVISLVSVLLLTVILVVLSYRYRWYLAYCFYKVKAKRKMKRFMTEDQPLLSAGDRFDGYVIYESDDRRFVRDNLQPMMEVKNDFKLHIWDRNSRAGSAKLEEVADGIYASDCVIAVLSKTALRDSWIRFQLDVALDRQMELDRDFLILVILENIEFKLLSKYWCVMFARMPCMRWCESEDDVRRTVSEQQLVQHCSSAKQLSVQ